ncbi:uncharacterized protein LOC110846110 [Folsomia candida]|nr:uncharacterized protein LOC110846110 [Folsomia candida]XP_035706116.1 uncharacterized protein LOC110846110 [Folsomia candida]
MGIQILKLADFYDVLPLVKIAESFILSNLWYSNCVQLSLTTKLILRSNISKLAFQFFKKNFQSVIKVNGHQQMSEEMWSDLLNCDILSKEIRELDLFLALFEWKQFSPESRQAPFESLVQFIRFPVMKPSEFTKYVIPTKVLQSQDVIDILSYFSDNGSPLHPLPYLNPSPRSPQTIRIIKSGSELRSLLKNSSPADNFRIIQLLPGEYKIWKSFRLSPGLTLRGSGVDSTIIKSVHKTKYNSPTARIILAESTTVSNLTLKSSSSKKLQIHVTSSHAQLHNLYFEGSTLSISGRKNHFTGIIFNNNRNPSCPCVHLMVTSRNNELHRINITDSATGIKFEGEENTINTLFCTNVSTGIELHGQNQILKNIRFRKIPEIGDLNAFFAIKIYSSSNNYIANVECEGLVGYPRTYAVVMRSDDQNSMKNHFIKNCSAGRVVIIGNEHTLTNVNAAEGFSIRGICHKLLDCKGDKAEYSLGVDYDEVSSSGRGDEGGKGWFQSIVVEDCNFTLKEC